MEKLKKKPAIILLCILLIISMLAIIIVPLTNSSNKQANLEEQTIKTKQAISESTATAERNVTLKSEATELKEGQEVSIDIYVTEGKVSYFSAYLDYDTDVFEEFQKSSISINKKLTADEDYGLWAKTWADTHQKISISENDGQAYNIPDDGYLGSIKFKVKKDTDTITTITLNEVALVDEHHKDIEIEKISIVIPKEKEEIVLTVDPNGGTWENSKDAKTFTDKKGATKQLSNPTETPKGHTVKFVSNGEEQQDLQIEQTTKFDKWTLEGGGKLEVQENLEGTTYTFENTDGTVKANYVGEKIQLPNITKSGSTFNGWYTSATGGEKAGNAGDYYTPDMDITLYAHWDKQEYNLTVNPNGGTWEGKTEKTIIAGENGSTKAITDPIPPKGEYVVTLDDNGKMTKLEQKMKFEKWVLTGKGSMEGIVYTFAEGEGELTAMYTKDIIELPTPERKGYTFDGWFDENNNKVDSNDMQNITKDESLHAKYTPNKYTITYENLKDSDNSANPTTYTIEDKDIILKDLPDKENAIFKGWYTTDDDTGEKVTSIDTSKLENITLYAQWEEDKLYLKSEKYKVGKNDIDVYEEGDIYLDKIEPETTVAEFIKNCDTNGTITVIDKNGKTLKEDELVGTGMTIKDKRFDEEIIMTAVVMGDLNGDGHVTVTDLSTLNHVILKEVQIQGAEFLAADLDDNEKISVTDLSTVNNAILKTITLTYTKNKKANNN